MMQDYSVDIQKLFLEFMVQDAQLFVRVHNIYNPENFDKSLRQTAKFIVDHISQYSTLPERQQIKAVTGVDLQPIENIESGHEEWFFEEFEAFTRRREVERAIIKSADLLEKGDYGPVETLVKNAVQISLTRDLGTDYFADPKARLQKLRENAGQISTGWANLDHKLFGGFSRGELNLFLGNSGAGKSTFLQNLAVNFVQNQLNGAYITLELSEELSSKRIDSMVTGIAGQEIFKEIDDVELRVKMAGKKAGALHLKYMAPTSTVNDIRAYLKELQIQKGYQCDFVCVDYLDLMMPVSAKVSPSDLFVKDKLVAEELRHMAKELKLVVCSASQFNRSGTDEIEFSHSNISGGLSKIFTADNVFGIFTSRALREHGKYQLQLMKTRSSSGVGSKIDLNWDINTLRITGLEPGQEELPSPVSSVLEKIKSKANTTSQSESGNPPIKVESNKLKKLLDELKANN